MPCTKPGLSLCDTRLDVNLLFPPHPNSTANIRNAFGHAPLHFASWGKQSATVQVLLQNGADVSPLTQRVALDLLPCPANSCPLHLAAQRGHIEISRILLKTFVSARNTTFPLSQSMQAWRFNCGYVGLFPSNNDNVV